MIVFELGLLGREATQTAFELGRKLGRDGNVAGLANELAKLVGNATIHVTTTGRQHLGGLPSGAQVFFDTARKDTIEIVGGPNATKIRQLIAGYAGGKPEKAIDVAKALGAALQAVNRNVEGRSSRIAADLSKFRREAEAIEGAVKGQLVKEKFSGKALDAELARRLDAKRALDAKYGQLRLNIASSEEALTELRKVNARIGNNIERLAKAEKPVIQEVSALLAAVGRTVEAEAKGFKFKGGPVAVAAGVIFAVAAGALVTNELLDKFEEKKNVPVPLKKPEVDF
ncbi:hypothetical protein J4450_04635 [Candidatus Micrarchaeota archaeon]|nr:hypothetical protein [Candidatus Micrarchaeota archaeon]